MGDFKLPPYVPTVLLVVALLVAIVMAYRLWSELKEDDEPASPLEMLSEFEEARAAGELDEQEFQRVRESLRKPREASPTITKTTPPATTGGADEPPAVEGQAPGSPPG